MLRTQTPWSTLFLILTSLLLSSAIDLSSLVLSTEAIVYEKGTLEYLSLIATWPVRSKDEVLPTIVIQPGNVQDVANIVKFSNNHKIFFSVKGGAHTDPATASDIVIDMSSRKNISIDPVSKTAVIETGVTMRDVDLATKPYGLAAVIGNCYTVGVGLYGFGGFGVLSRIHGLALDNIIYYDVVTADGELVRASDTENPDLFFALRGALPNFGIAVSLKIKLHDVLSNFYGGNIQFLAEPTTFKRFWQWFAPYTSDRNFSLRTVLFKPTGQPQFFNVDLVIWGDTLTLSEKQAIFQDLFATVNGTVLSNNVGSVMYFTLTHIYDIGSGIPFPTLVFQYARSTSATELTDELIDAIFQTSLLIGENNYLGIDLHGGAISDVPSNATAFFHRNLLYDIYFYAFSDTSFGILEKKRFFDGLIQSLLYFPQLSVNTFYVNHNEYSPQYRDNSFGENLPRLKKIKAKWDPKRILRTGFNIPPDTSVCRKRKIYST